MAAPRMTTPRPSSREGHDRYRAPVERCCRQRPRSHARCHALRPGADGRADRRFVLSNSHLRLVVDNRKPPDPCSCRTWGLLRAFSRDLVLDDLMQWAKLWHGVGLTLTTCGEHVVVSGLMATMRTRGGARRVLTDLCSWADCARVTLELAADGLWSAGSGHPTAFYVSLGFRRDPAQPALFDLPGSLIRHPIRGQAHVRL